MTTNTHRRLTASPPEDNLADIINIIEIDALARLDNAEQRVGRLEARTALALLLRQALDELASYWPGPTCDAETDQAMFDLHFQLSGLRADARPVEVLRYAAQTIVQLRQDAAEAADEIATVGVAVAALEPEPEGGSHRAAVPTVNWDWESRVWEACPIPIQVEIGQLQSGAQTWTDIAPGRRQSIVRHVASRLGDPDIRTFDLARPGWMPPARSLTQSFKLSWRKLLELEEPGP